MWAQLRDTPKWKLALAVCGLLTLIAGGVLAGTMIVEHKPPEGVSDLALHPERQDEIVTQREAEKYRETLDLTAEQTQRIATILLEDRKRRLAQRSAEFSPQAMMLSMQQRSAMTQSIRNVLTPEQIEKFNEMPEGMRDQFMRNVASMTSEQREQFGQQMRQQMGDGGPPGFGRRPGPGFGPGFGPPPPRQGGSQ